MSESIGDNGPVDPLLHPAQGVIQVFGGIRPMAHKLGIAVSTVQGWKERGTIPRSRHPEIQAAAAAAGLSLDPGLLAASDQTQAPIIEGVGAPVLDQPGPAVPTPDDAPEDLPGTAEPALHPTRQAPGWIARLARQLPAVALGGLLVFAGFLLASGTSDLWLDRPGAPADNLAAGDLAAVETRLAALEARPAAEAAAPWQREIEGRIEALAQQLAALPAGGDPAAAEALRAELLAAARAAAEQGQQAAAAELAALGATLDEARKELADLAARVSGLAAAGGAGGTSPDWAERLTQEAAALADRVTALEATAGALAGRLGALDQLDQRIADSVAAAVAALPQPEPAPTADPAAAALALAAAGLQEAVVAGRAYAEELALLRRLAAGDAAIGGALDRLAAGAEQGVASESRLVADFPAVARAVVAAEQGAGQGDWFDDLWRSLGDLVSVRPIGEVAGESATARVARAEQRLAAGDLAAAVAELEGLQGAPAEAAAAWLAAARSRLETVAAAAALAREALARLAAGG